MGSEGERGLIEIVFASRLFEKILEYCDTPSIKNVRLVNHTFQIKSKKYILRRYYINWSEGQQYVSIEYDTMKGESFFDYKQWINVTNFIINKDQICYAEVIRCADFCGHFEKLQNTDMVTELIFGFYFNQTFGLPVSLTHLTFGYIFNQNVDQLPVSLTHLTFGSDFNQSVYQLPSSLTHLTFALLEVEHKEQIEHL